ncbi:MAG: regulatory protein RecX [Syntrophotaleaceae bacterium]
MKKFDPFAVALRLLTARERSGRELAERLRQKGFDDAACDETVARCRSLGYLDDARFARGRARQLLESGRAVGRHLLLDLQQHGISESLAREILSELEQEQSPRQVLENLLQRRFPGFDYDRADDRERRRVINFFLRRGFDLALVLDRIKGRVLD